MICQGISKRLLIFTAAALGTVAVAVAQEPAPQEPPMPPQQEQAEVQPAAQPPMAPPEEPAAMEQVPQQEPVGTAPLQLPAGTLVSVRIDQSLASDRNQPGDTFTGTLTQPLVAQGIVVAQRGQMVLGRVVDVKKAKGFGGSSQLKLALTKLILVDGQSLPVATQLMVTRSGSTAGRDTGVVATTTGAGALIGAAADGGAGAGIGAGVGLAAGLAGVLATKGHDTVVYAETRLLFETTAPVEINTSAAPQAFHAVDSNTYTKAAAEERIESPRQPRPNPRPYPAYGWCGPYWDPFCYGPNVWVVGGYWHGGGHWRGAPYRGGWRHR